MKMDMDYRGTDQKWTDVPLSEVHLVLSIHLSPSSTLQKNIGGGACRPQWNKWEIIC